LDPEAGIVNYRVETSRFPNWERSEQVRYFRVSGNQLLIDSAPIQFRGSEWVIQVVFVRPDGFAG
jgi:hypothetical protein